MLWRKKSKQSMSLQCEPVRLVHDLYGTPIVQLILNKAFDALDALLEAAL